MTAQGRTFGKYVILKLLGIGGAGKVFLVKEPETGRKFALKALQRAVSEEETTTHLRFRREFRAASRMKHPHLVEVYESGVFEDQEYYTMEYIEGHDFDEHLFLFTKKLDLEDPLNDPQRIQHVLDLLIQTTEGLSFLHSHNYIHRDIKPGNILVSKDGIVKLTDFGLVRELNSSQLTQTGSILGTVEYMSPEQTITARVDPRSDIYSLGVVAYKAFTGKPVFSGSITEQLIARSRKHVPDPRLVNPSLNIRISRILMRMLQRRPEDRYPSARHLLEDLMAVREKLFGDSTAGSSSQMTYMGRNFLLPPAQVGREREMRALLQALEELKSSGVGSLFLISGETGIGKTFLAEEIHTQAAFHGIPFIKSACSKNIIWGFQVWIHLIEKCEELIRNRNIEMPAGYFRIRDLLSDLIDRIQKSAHLQDSQNEATKYRFFDAATQFFSLAGQAFPLIIHLEDFHWSDNASIELLQFVMRRTIFSLNRGITRESPSRLMFIITFNEEELPENHPLTHFPRMCDEKKRFHQFRLSRLNKEQVEEMIHSMLGGEHVSSGFCSSIYRETNGNPMFVETTIRALVEEGELKRRGNIWLGKIVSTGGNNPLESSVTGTIPQMIIDKIRLRLSSLGPEERSILHTAAILGDVFELDILLRVVEEDEDAILDALDSLLKNGIIVEKSSDDEIYGFSSHFLREVVRKTMDADARKRLHGKIACYMKKHQKNYSIEDRVRYAYHIIESGEQTLELSSVCKELGTYFFHAGSFDRSAFYLKTAIENAPVEDSFERDYLKLMYADCNLSAGNKDIAETLYLDLIKKTSRKLHALETVESEPLLVKIHCLSLLGFIVLKRGEYAVDKVLAILRIIVEKASRYNVREAAIRARTFLGSMLTSVGDCDTALAYLHEAIQLAEKEGLSGELAECHHALGNIFFGRNELDSALKNYEIALSFRMKTSNESGIAAIKTNIGNVLKMQGKLEQAAEYYREAVEIAESTGDYKNWPLYLHNIATVQLLLGQTHDSISNFKKALVVFQEQNNIEYSAMCLNNLGNAVLEAYRFKEALKVYSEAYKLYSRLNYPNYCAAILVNLSYVSILMNQIGNAEEFINRAEELYADLDSVAGKQECNLFAAYIYLKTERVKKADEILSEMASEKIIKDSFTEGIYLLVKSEWMRIHGKTEISEENSPAGLLKKSIDIFEHLHKFQSANLARKMLAQYLIDEEIDPEKGKAMMMELQYTMLD